MKGLQVLARDHARLPMQWVDKLHIGFTDEDVALWMRAHDAYPHNNVKQQENDPGSVLSYWKKMLKLSKEHRDVFIYGEFDIDNEQTFIYSQHFGGEAAVVVLNFTAEEQSFKLPAGFEGRVQLVQANTSASRCKKLLPYEARIYLLDCRLRVSLVRGLKL